MWSSPVPNFVKLTLDTFRANTRATARPTILKAAVESLNLFIRRDFMFLIDTALLKQTPPPTPSPRRQIQSSRPSQMRACTAPSSRICRAKISPMSALRQGTERAIRHSRSRDHVRLVEVRYRLLQRRAAHLRAGRRVHCGLQAGERDRWRDRLRRVVAHKRRRDLPHAVAQAQHVVVRQRRPYRLRDRTDERTRVRVGSVINNVWQRQQCARTG